MEAILQSACPPEALPVCLSTEGTAREVYKRLHAEVTSSSPSADCSRSHKNSAPWFPSKQRKNNSLPTKT